MGKTYFVALGAVLLISLNAVKAEQGKDLHSLVLGISSLERKALCDINARRAGIESKMAIFP